MKVRQYLLYLGRWSFPLLLALAPVGCGDSAVSQGVSPNKADSPPPATASEPTDAVTKQSAPDQSASDREPQPRNIFGPDNRREVISEKYPWRVVGKLVECGCTGTLVGPDLVLTAAHCVMDPNTKQLVEFPMSFHPNYRDGRSAASSPVIYVWWGTNDPDTFRAHDWAVLRLNDRLGDQFGWLGIDYADAGSFPDNLMVIGYSGDYKNGASATADWTGRTRSVDAESGLIMHDCDATRGSSGGPVLSFNQQGQLSIFGLNVAERRMGGDVSLQVSEYSDAYSNIAIPSMRFLPTVRDLRANESSGSSAATTTRQAPTLDVLTATEPHVPTQVLPAPKPLPPAPAAAHAGEGAFPAAAK